MTMRRRIFLKGIAGALALTSIAAKKRQSTPVEFDRNLVSVLLGPSFDGQSEFSIVHCQKESLRYLIYKEDQLLQDVTYSTVTFEDDEFKIDKFLVQNLPIDRELKIRVICGNKQLDERIFSSISSKRSSYKIGIASCMRAAQHEKAMWTSLEAQNADVNLFVGDCVYIDYNHNGEPTPKVHWNKFVEARMVLDFYQWKRLVPTVAIWDDHDFGGDNSDKNFPYSAEAKAHFKHFFAQNLSEHSFITAGPGISCRFQLGNQLFLMLDGRSFREKPHSKKMYSMFGKEQEEWIFDSIKDFDGLVWFCNGTQWFSNYGLAESFRKDYAINFNSFIEKLNLADKQMIFVAGDVHYSEICTTPNYLKNKSIELTSSCMHSSNSFVLPPVGNSPYRMSATWLRNFMVCQTTEAEKTITVATDCFTKNKRRLFTNKVDFDLS